MSNTIAYISKDNNFCETIPFGAKKCSSEEIFTLWQKQLTEDIQVEKHIKDYRIFRMFRGFPQKQRNKIASYLRVHFSLKEFFYPPGKVCLAQEKDELDNERLKNYSAKHLLVILYSLKIQKVKELKNETANNPIGNYNVNDNFQKRLSGVYSLIAELNTLMPFLPVMKMEILDIAGTVEGGYIGAAHKLLITLNNHVLDTVAHEMGHAIFRVKLGGEAGTPDKHIAVKDKIWQKIYYLSLGYRSYEIVDDSNYIKGAIVKKDGTGHPFDSANELFASAIMAYRLHPKEFIKNILDPDTNERARRLGKLLFCYLRDNIFSGKVFGGITDPFQRESFEIKDEDIIVSLISALKDKDHNVRRAAVQAIDKLGLRDTRVMEALMGVLGDNDESISWAVAETIGKLGDAKSVESLIGALGDKNWRVRRGAAWAVGELGLESERFAQPLIKLLSETRSVCRAAVGAIRKLGIKDERLNALLVKALGDVEAQTRYDVAEFIGEIRDERLVEPLIGALGSSDHRMREGAILAIDELGIKDARFEKPLLKALKDEKRFIRAKAAEVLARMAVERLSRIFKGN